MNLLAIDSSGSELCVVAAKGEELFVETSNGEKKKHNALIMPFIDSVLAKAELTLRDLDYCACVVGPGSFTGIRLGVATLKALCFGAGIKAAGLDGLRLAGYGKSGGFMSAVTARIGNYYGAQFEDGAFGNVREGYFDDDALSRYDGEIILDRYIDARTLIDFAKESMSRGVFDAALAPLYLRKSQAERERDGD